MKAKNVFMSCIAVFLVLNLMGCEAFVRKFTRKKKDTGQKEEMVLAPVEYKPAMDHAQSYKQYLLFWKSWQDELISALLSNASVKKRLDCASQAIKNLISMKALLSQDKQAIMDKYIVRMIDLQEMVANDTYSRSASNHRQKAEDLKMDILREFSFNKV